MAHERENADEGKHRTRRAGVRRTVVILVVVVVAVFAWTIVGKLFH